jgi:hypothetical protein
MAVDDVEHLPQLVAPRQHPAGQVRPVEPADVEGGAQGLFPEGAEVAETP